MESKARWITFIAEYRDGTLARFAIDPRMLKSGDHVARASAGERQEKGSLKPGDITLVYRAR